MTEKDKIKQYLEYKGISKNSFYKKTGLSIGFLDSGKSLGVDKLKIIINNYQDINLHWLVLGEGEMLRNSNDAGASVQQVEPTIIYRDNPDKDEIIQLLRDKVKLLEQNAKQSSPQLGFYAPKQSPASPAAEDTAPIVFSTTNKPRKGKTTT